MATKITLNTIWHIPDDLWKIIQPLLGPEKPVGTRGRPPVPYRTVLDGILYVLRTGCQWKAAPKEFGSGSTLHRRFQQWVTVGIFLQLWAQELRRYQSWHGILWRWQSLDAVITKAPLGGEATDAIEHFVNLACIALGILQYLALVFLDLPLVSIRRLASHLYPFALGCNPLADFGYSPIARATA